MVPSSASPLARYTLSGLLKKAWNEIPDIVCGTGLAVSSVAAAIGVYFYKKNTGKLDIYRYRYDFTVVRSDDPLAKHAPQNIKPRE